MPQIVERVADAVGCQTAEPEQADEIRMVADAIEKVVGRLTFDAALPSCTWVSPATLRLTLPRSICRSGNLWLVASAASTSADVDEESSISVAVPGTSAFASSSNLAVAVVGVMLCS
jgi:hypothetical protein